MKNETTNDVKKPQQFQRKSCAIFKTSTDLRTKFETKETR